MASDVKNYDPAGVAVVFGGFLITGFAKGSFIRIVRSQANFTHSVSADGREHVRNKTNDRSAMCEIMLEQTALANLVLSNAASRDEAQGDVVVPFAVTDVNSPDTIYASGKAWIEKPADAVLAEQSQPRTWQIKLLEVPMKHAGTPGVAVLTQALS